MNAEKFKTWLNACGAEVLLPTNEWELVRFRTVNGVSIVYRNKYEELTFTGESMKAYKLFGDGKRWRVVNRKRAVMNGLKNRIAARDGKKCFFCEYFYKELAMYTVEHILSFSHGGPDNVNNLALACPPCQKELGNMSITQKILFRDKMLKLSLDELRERQKAYVV